MSLLLAKSQLQRNLNRIRDYKLRHAKFSAYGILGPPSSGTSVGSVCPIAVTYGSEPQLLVHMSSAAQLVRPIEDHLRCENGRWVGVGSRQEVPGQLGCGTSA